ncbi:hypothetical protein BC829DRAFT_413610 [Chytridium lagenaria]|nr:hypothetical protein BC829DRAFT_413610 [Chytridium lagenaria]
MSSSLVLLTFLSQRHPDARDFRKKLMLNVDLLEVLCPRHVATGKFAVGLKKEAPAHTCSKQFVDPSRLASMIFEKVAVKKGSDKEGSIYASDRETDNKEEKRMAKQSRAQADDKDADFNKGYNQHLFGDGNRGQPKTKRSEESYPDKKADVEVGFLDVLAGLYGWLKSKKNSLEDVSEINLNLHGQNVSADSNAVLQFSKPSSISNCSFPYSAHMIRDEVVKNGHAPSKVSLNVKVVWTHVAEN